MLASIRNNRVIESHSALCAACREPLDSQYFDDSRVVEAPGVGVTVTLAEFELPPQYCGVLEYFAQFTDEYALDNSRIETPGVEWLILADGGPLFPYLTLKHIVNPWGKGAFPISVRLQENTTLKFVARGVSGDSTSTIARVGGRLLGRFWYNSANCDVGQRHF